MRRFLCKTQCCGPTLVLAFRHHTLSADTGELWRKCVGQSRLPSLQARRGSTYTHNFYIYFMLWHFAVSGGWGYFKCLYKGIRGSPLAVQNKSALHLVDTRKILEGSLLQAQCRNISFLVVKRRDKQTRIDQSLRNNFTVIFAACRPWQASLSSFRAHRPPLHLRDTLSAYTKAYECPHSLFK